MGDRARAVSRKVGDCCAPFRGGAGPPSNTMWPGPRPTCVRSDILIHPTVWPQYTNVTDNRTDNGPIVQGETITCNGRPIYGVPVTKCCRHFHNCPNNWTRLL